MEQLVIVVALGVVAGVVTTMAGMGGGLMLLLSLSVLWGPSKALAVTAPALLLGNLHRLHMYRASVDRRRALAFALGALPGALLGGLSVAWIPPTAVQVLMVAITLLAVARATLRLRFTVPVTALAPAGLVVGALTGAAGGAGLLVAPLLHASGLEGIPYVATIAASAVVMHTGRILGYAGAGLFDRHVLALSALGAVAILGGNLVGKRLRRLSERLPKGALEYGVLVLAVTLSVAGVSH